MSILRDLEPQSTKIHQNTSSGSTTKLAWMLGALLLVGGVTWLTFYLQAAKSVSTGDTTSPFPPSSLNNNVTRTLDKTLANTTPESSRSEAPPATRAALITENAAAQASAKAAQNDPPNVFQTMQMELEKSQNDKVAANNPAQNHSQKSAVAAETPKPQTSKAANEGNKPAKAAATTSKAAATSGNGAPRTAKSDKRFAERDIDIITAIVK